MAKLPKPAEMLDISYNPPKTPWMDLPLELREGMYCHAGKPESAQIVSLPNVREWRVPDEDWKLPDNWQENHSSRASRPSQSFPFIENLHGLLCSLWCVCGQVSLLPWKWGSKEHACIAC